MSDDQRAYWQAYIDTLKPIMRLCDWRIDLKPEPADDDADAQTWIADNYQTACIYLGAEWETFDRSKQREIMAHELIHIHLQRLSTFGEKVGAQLGGQAKGLADEMRHHFLENATEELSRAFAPFLPLPPKVKREKQAA